MRTEEAIKAVYKQHDDVFRLKVDLTYLENAIKALEEVDINFGDMLVRAERRNHRLLCEQIRETRKKVKLICNSFKFFSSGAIIHVGDLQNSTKDVMGILQMIENANKKVIVSANTTTRLEN